MTPLAPDPKTRKDAIYHVPGGAGTYTCLTAARFLGWTVDAGNEPTRACRIAFDAWHAHHTTGVDVAEYVQKIPASKQTTLVTEPILKAVTERQGGPFLWPLRAATKC